MSIESELLDFGVENISSQVSSNLQQELLNHQAQIQSWLSEAYFLRDNIEKDAQLFEKQTYGLHLNKSGMYMSDKKSRVYERWYAAKQQIIDKNSETKVRQLLTRGYVLIDKIRQQFTNEPVTYEVAFSLYDSKTKMTHIYEAQLPLKEILDISKVEAVWRNSSVATSLKLRLNADVATKQSWLNNYNVKELTDDKVYKEVMSYNKVSDLKNKGNQYEIYKKFNRLSSELNISDKNARIELLDQIISEVKSNTASFVKGGDDQYVDETGNYHNISLKSFIGGNPSLASFSTLISTLEQLYGAFDLQSLSSTAIYSPMRSKLKENSFVQKGIDQIINNILQENLSGIFH